jgi:hypothetical protein
MQTPVDLTPGGNTYEIKLRILGNEVFGFALTSSSSDNRWVLGALVTIFSLLTLVGAYGEKIVNLYHAIVG